MELEYVQNLESLDLGDGIMPIGFVSEDPV